MVRPSPLCSRRATKLLLAASIVPFLLSSEPLRAAAATWTIGAGTSDWSTSSNWTGVNTPPLSGDSLIFDTTAGATALNNTLTSSAFNVAGITFTAGASAYTISGNAFTLTGNITNTLGALNSQTIGNNMTLSAGAHTISVSGNTGVVLSGDIDGTGSIAISGNTAGYLTLSGNNTFSGGVATGGRGLKIGSSTALGTGTLTMGAGTVTALDNVASGALTLTNAVAIGNSSIVNFAGSKSMTLGALTYNGSAGGYRTINVMNNTLTFNGATTDAVGGSTLTKQGLGTLVLNGDFTGTGATTIQQGTLQLGSVSALGAVGNTVTVGYSANTATIDMATDTSVNAYKIVTANGGVSQFISNRATAGAGITHTLGTLAIGNGPALNFLAGSNVTSGQAAVAFGAATTSAGANGYTVTFNPTTAAVTLASLTNISTVSGTTTALLGGTSQGTITGGIIEGVNGKYAVTKSNSSTWTVTGASSYTGATKISGGALQANEGAGLSSSSYVQLDGGVLQSNGAASFTRTLSATANGANFDWTANGGGFSANGGKFTVNVNSGAELTWGNAVGTNLVGTLKFGSATANAETELQNGINVSGATRTIDVAAGTGGDFATVSGVIRNSSGTAAGITKMGAGKLVLSAANTYNGATIINGGELDINGSLAAASAVSVNSGATLGGTGTVNGTVGVNGGTIKGTGLQMGVTTIQGNSTLSGTNTATSIAVTSGTTTASGKTTTNSGLAVSAGATLINSGTLAGSLNVSGLLRGTGTVDGAFMLETGGELSLQINKINVFDSLAAGVNYDQIAVNGAVTLAIGNVLNFSTLNNGQIGDVFNLIVNDGSDAIGGTFTTVEVGGVAQTITNNAFVIDNVKYSLSYTGNADGGLVGNDVTLTLMSVPEPATWVMLLGGLGMLAFGQKLRQRSNA